MKPGKYNLKVNELRFAIINTSPQKLPTDINHLNFRWLGKGCNIMFSVARQGNAASCHFSSDRKGLRKLKQAINEWCEFVFWMFDWCEMIIGKVEKENISKLLKECDFKLCGKADNVLAYVRLR